MPTLFSRHSFSELHLCLNISLCPDESCTPAALCSVGVLRRLLFFLVKTFQGKAPSLKDGGANPPLIVLRSFLLSYLTFKNEELLFFLSLHF